MTKGVYLSLAVLGLATALAVANFQSSPGYMDADYYYAGGLRLATGHGFSEMILWNYLDDPAGLPHPSHGYWMPLVSIVAGIGMFLGGANFGAARLGFLLLAAAIPPLTAALSFSITGRRDLALIAGLLAVLPGFYLSYLSTTDAFSLYMVCGALFFLVLPRAFPLGLLAGLFHLIRADGLMWLAIALFCVIFAPASRSGGRWKAVATCLAGYLLIMGPWMARNLLVFGAPLAPGGSRALWITRYDELFLYPASLLTPQHWWASGLRSILEARLWAAGLNLQNALAVQASIFLLPLILVGLWRLRGQLRVQAACLAWLLTFLAMTVIFPFQGARGGFFHSGAALQLLFWAAAPLGLDVILEWVSQRRGWEIGRARRLFQFGLVWLAFLITALVSFNRVIGDGSPSSGWDASYNRYRQAEVALVAKGATPDAIVMVNNAPGYFVAAGRPAISIPYVGLPVLLEVARRYQASYLLMELDQVPGEQLYNQPGDRPGLRYLGEAAGVHIYAILQGESFKYEINNRSGWLSWRSGW
jgi:hypothetical protein